MVLILEPILFCIFELVSNLVTICLIIEEIEAKENQIKSSVLVLLIVCFSVAYELIIEEKKKAI